MRKRVAALRLWQGSSSVLCGRVQIAESGKGGFFIRSTEYSNFGRDPSYGVWCPIVLKPTSFQKNGRKIITNITTMGSVHLTQIGGAYKLRLPAGN